MEDAACLYSIAYRALGELQHWQVDVLDGKSLLSDLVGVRGEDDSLALYKTSTIHWLAQTISQQDDEVSPSTILAAAHLLAGEVNWINYISIIADMCRCFSAISKG